MTRRVAIACTTESLGAKVIICVDIESLTFSDFIVSPPFTPLVLDNAVINDRAYAISETVCRNL